MDNELKREPLQKLEDNERLVQEPESIKSEVTIDDGAL